MGKTSKPSKTKERAKKYDAKLSIKGTLDQVLQVAVKSASKPKK